MECEFSTGDDKFKDHCGVFAVFGHNSSAELTALGLKALQHRGQESVGIVSCSIGEKKLSFHKGVGLVGENFSKKENFNNLKGNLSIGHVRYSTSGGKDESAIQPFIAELSYGSLALSHNGNLSNYQKLRKPLQDRGVIFQSHIDTEVLVHLIALSKKDNFYDKFTDALSQVEGAYSLLSIFNGKLYAMKDPFGIRPLCIGKLGDAIVISSETCGLTAIGAELIREIENGEMLIIDENSIESKFPLKKQKSKFCVFEYIYFSRADSIINNISVYESRKRMGKILAKNTKHNIDVVIPVPDSGLPAGLGFAEESGKKFEFGIIKNNYIGRTFISPDQKARMNKVKTKHSANVTAIKGKNIALIDDSIVRGTTMKRIIEMLKSAGANEVHIYVSSPPTRFSCNYGIDTPTLDELIFNKLNGDLNEISKYLGSDSINYISIDGIYKAMGKDIGDYCDVCFSGENFI
jgi:amidophosphoribosyltransferase